MRVSKYTGYTGYHKI